MEMANDNFDNVDASVVVSDRAAHRGDLDEILKHLT